MTAKMEKWIEKISWFKTNGECPFCGKIFVYSGAYYSHITKKHDKECEV